MLYNVYDVLHYVFYVLDISYCRCCKNLGFKTT